MMRHDTKGSDTSRVTHDTSRVTHDTKGVMLDTKWSHTGYSLQWAS